MGCVKYEMETMEIILRLLHLETPTFSGGGGAGHPQMVKPKRCSHLPVL
jgi:hypothetical protein